MLLCWCFPVGGRGDGTTDAPLTIPSKSKDLFVPLSSTDSSDGSMSYYTIEDESYHIASDGGEDQLDASYEGDDFVAVDVPPLDSVVVKQKSSTGATIHEQDQGATVGPIQPEPTTPIGNIQAIPAFVDSSSPQCVTRLEVIFEEHVLDDFASPMKQDPLEDLDLPPLRVINETVVATTTTSTSSPRRPLPQQMFKLEQGAKKLMAAVVTKKTVSKSRSSNARLPPRPNQDGDIFGLSVLQRRRRRRVHSYPEHQNSSGATSPVVNKDLQLEIWLEANDIGNLWLEYNLRRSRNGDNSPRVGQILLCIGILALREKQYATAVKHFEEAAQCTQGDHKRVEAGFVDAEARYNLGVLALETGDVAAAESCIADGLYRHQENEMNHGRDPNAARIIARCLHTLGMVRTRKGDLESALKTLQWCADICEQLVESDPLELSTVLDAIGVVCFHAGDFDTALLYHQDALEIKAKALGERHVSLVLNYKKLAVTYTANDKHSSAANAYVRAEALLRRSYKHHQRRRNKDRISDLASQLGEMHEMLASSASKLRADGGSSFLSFISRARNYYEVAGERAKVRTLAALIAENTK
eukprot:CAMPEP_0119015730 /NCGR_PEP_ID=MMETSP1176-20130426/11498_1 /TAXON_ID=265551 /ORGANISM="Synedropsis recta cf, Strain CCMP1620" /LENGTH=584 /DNA_ID=CAMNT_0006969043 /DNA_START=144 /DNA_END=1898 /DNA_ORIENTATION=+